MKIVMFIAAATVLLTLTGCGSFQETPDIEPVTPPTTSSIPATRPTLTDSETAARTDTVFLQMLDSYGIDYGTDGGDSAVVMGHTVCDALDRGVPEPELLPALMEDGPGYSRAHATLFIETSIAVYCPQHA
ncbi:DUF732 domain-containing protein [Rhodococcus chondri]|uniref:DUF732 domain-containing protein n=1 Tax=Rhodococcus chondri TaxID=3065941 RepID=A0ABU7JYP8_9NOCA|nr:DUF732 domain-containing protein [Rhodococcus sp. CC-R104]MEE2035132.1 DUF732 domain-containing protein [Rhodococcus sp. CC-R104]